MKIFACNFAKKYVLLFRILKRIDSRY